MSSEDADQPVLFFRLIGVLAFSVSVELIDSLCGLRRTRLGSMVARPILVFVVCQLDILPHATTSSAFLLYRKAREITRKGVNPTG